MKCQDVRLAIDIASHREPMGRSANIHLNNCQDCRHYADETGSLLRLISDQPRVQAPPDFDFKLRARIARAENERQRPAVFWARLWARSFSWSEAAAVAAGVALAVTLTTYNFIHNEQSNQSPQDVAQNPASLADAGTKSPAIESKTSATSVAAATRVAVRPVAVKPGSRMAKVPSTIEKSPLAGDRQLSVETGWRGYSSTRDQFVSAPSGYLYGAEGSNSRYQKIAASF